MQYLLYNTPKGGLASCNVGNATNGCGILNYFPITLATNRMNRFTYKPLAWITLSVAGFTSPALGQKQVTHQSQYWIRYYGKYTVSDTWNLSFEIEDRHFFKNNRQSNWFLPRVAAERNLGKGWSAGAGFTYYLASNPADPAKQTAVTVPELRPHQYLTSSQTLGNMGISHRFQLEERWIHNSTSSALTPGYHFQGRVRYRFQLKYPLIRRETAKGNLSAIASDEILLNVGHEIVANTFDQNRIYFGLNYGISRAFQVELGYLNWFQERSSGNQYYQRDIARLTIYHDLKLY